VTCPFLPRTVVSDRRLALKDQERVFGRFSSQHKPSHRSHELLRPVFQLCTCPAIRNRWEHDPGDGESSTSRSGSLLRLDSTSHTPAMPSSPLLMVTSEAGAPAEVLDAAEVGVEVAERLMIHENASTCWAAIVSTRCECDLLLQTQLVQIKGPMASLPTLPLCLPHLHDTRAEVPGYQVIRPRRSCDHRLRPHAAKPQPVATRKHGECESPPLHTSPWSCVSSCHCIFASCPCPTPAGETTREIWLRVSDW
jgi:hypothetical protein